MKFFNKKEDVIDLQLTQYGKYLLSQGKLKPEYYAFFDDDVIYDIGKARSTETNRETKKRITALEFKFTSSHESCPSPAAAAPPRHSEPPHCLPRATP